MRGARWCGAMVAAMVVVCAATLTQAARIDPYYPYKFKEFDIVRNGSTFHVFYIRQDLTFPADSTTIEFGHAVSSNLRTWTHLDPVLTVRRDKWDKDHVWAPSIVRQNGLWYMLYTGVTNTAGQYAYHQRTGLAVSADLFNWTRLDEPVWSCSNVPWTYCNPLTYDGGDFRDPCVIPEPGVPGNWLMYTACRPASSPGQMLIGVARSTGDLSQWTDVKPLWNTGTARTFSPLVESPELVDHNGLWYLFYTTNSGHALSYQMSTDPLADSTGWSQQVRLSQEVPEEPTDAWFGIEFFRDQGHDYLLAANGAQRGIEVREVVWDDAPHFHLIEPTAYNVTLDVPGASPSAIQLERIATGAGAAARFRVTLPLAGDARLDVIDVLGRPVRNVIDGPMPAGGSEVAWDGVDRDGRAARSGIYFARLTTATGQRAVRFARVH